MVKEATREERRIKHKKRAGAKEKERQSTGRLSLWKCGSGVHSKTVIVLLLEYVWTNCLLQHIQNSKFLLRTNYLFKHHARLAALLECHFSFNTNSSIVVIVRTVI